LVDTVSSIRRATVKVGFEAYRLGSLVNSTAIPTMVPTFINTSIPTLNISISTDERRLQNSELKLYEEEKNETRQLQTNSSSLQICLIKYVKIVQIVQQITVPLPNNVTSSDYVLILESLLSNQEYIKLINKWALYYGVPVSLNVSTSVCGYVTLKSEPSQLPTFGPSTDPSILPTSFPSTTPSIAPAVAPTFLPSAFPTDIPTASLCPSISPTEQPSTLPSIAPALPPTFTPSLSPTDAPTTAPKVSPTSAPSREPTPGPTQVIGE
jgi:hypothetical protein